jgi:hypothetical protein
MLLQRIFKSYWPMITLPGSSVSQNLFLFILPSFSPLEEPISRFLMLRDIFPDTGTKFMSLKAVMKKFRSPRVLGTSLDTISSISGF